MEIDIYWRDWRSLCGVKFLRLEEFIDDVRHGMALQLEPQGLLFAEIKFLNPMISRKPKLQRQRKIFKQQGNTIYRRTHSPSLSMPSTGTPTYLHPRRHLPAHPVTSTLIAIYRHNHLPVPSTPSTVTTTYLYPRRHLPSYFLTIYLSPPIFTEI